jgi:glycosyltransferase involved in cell wall biosynthesis
MTSMTRGKIKVLETIRQGKIGGGESHVLDLVEEMDKSLYEPVVLSFTEGPMIDRLQSMGITTYVIPTEQPFDISKWGLVKQILEQENISLVHAHGTRANSNVYWAAKRLGLPLIYTVHGWSFHPDQDPFTRYARIAGERYLSQQANVTICVSDNNLQDATKEFHLPNAAVIKYGIDLKKFNTANSFKDIRKEFGIKPSTVLVGYIARITTQKDPFTFIRAIAGIPASMDIKFLVVGDGDLKPAMIQLAKELRVSSRIIFSEFRQDIPDILNAIDIYCLPSLWEGLPIGLLEAMAMKKAIVATAVDGTKEVIHHQQNGLLVPPYEYKKLASALVQLAANPDLIRAYGEKAYLEIKDQFSAASMTRKVERIYKNLAADVVPAGINAPYLQPSKSRAAEFLRYPLTSASTISFLDSNTK